MVDPINNYRESLIPASVLNGLGKPQVYDHWFAGQSRVQLKRAAEKWKRHSPEHAAEFENAMTFFDEIGWLTPLKIQEGGEEPNAD